MFRLSTSSLQTPCAPSHCINEEHRTKVCLSLALKSELIIHISSISDQREPLGFRGLF